MVEVDKLKGMTVAVDTAPFIYYIEKNKNYFPYLKDFFLANNEGKFLMVTSTITLLEVLVLPLRNNQINLANSYKSILTQSKTINLVSIGVTISQLAAKLRAKYSIRTPDSIQLAVAINSNADYFFTNDKNLKVVEDISVITLE